MNFDNYVQEGNLFLKRLAEELGNPNDTDHAARVAVSVFHALRERISIEESMHLVSQLPMIIKGIYIDGWDILHSRSSSKTVQEFLNDVRQHNARTAARDFGNDEQAREKVTAVFRALKHYVADGELQDIKAQLPDQLAELIEA